MNTSLLFLFSLIDLFQRMVFVLFEAKVILLFQCMFFVVLLEDARSFHLFSQVNNLVLLLFVMNTSCQPIMTYVKHL